MTDRSGALVITRQPVRGEPRREVYQPLATGGFERTEERHNGCRWVAVGSERVEAVAIENAEVVADA